MELRRALLLFAIVLGMAAIASSVARTPDSDEETATESSPSGTTTGPPAAATPVARPAAPTEIRFKATAEPQTRELAAGRPATVVVEVQTPGQVDIPSLGLTEPAEPLTPATFDVLATAPGSHAITVQAAGADTLPSRAGTLKVVPAS